MLLRVFKVLLFFSLLVVVFLFYQFNQPIVVTYEEVIQEGETEQIQRSVDNFLKIVENNKTDYVARGAHSKGHACIKAYFDVDENIASNLQYGVFKIPGNRYKAWIRFSNGASSVKDNHDYKKDARGMAVKLIDVYEQGIHQNSSGQKYQDLLIHDSPVFFAANIIDYNKFTESNNKILYFVSDPNPFNWKLRELMHGLATLKEPPSSLLHNQYFSNTAYKFGPHNIKFSAKSCKDNATETDIDRKDEDFLRKVMAKELTLSEGCFNFMIQIQDPEKAMPIENPSIIWKEEESAYISIAKITIPKQQFDTPEQQQFCEDLSFSPWNALPEHRPIGELNRIRKAVYEASSRYRHEKNRTQAPTNLDW